jgi:hypothetical protein
MSSCCQIGVFRWVCSILAHFFRVASVLGFFFQKIQLEMFPNVGRYYGPKFQRILAKLEEIMIRLGYFDVFATFWPLFQSCISFGNFFFKIKSSWRDFQISVVTWAKILKNSWKVRKITGHVIKLGHFNLFVAFWPHFSELYQC